MTTADLQERLRSGKGADRELDREICTHFNDSPDLLDMYPLPAYTSDLNVVFALVERKLPEWDWMWGKNSLAKKRYYVVLTKYNSTGDDPLVIDRISNIGHDDACRALLLALLAAKEPQP